VATLRPAVIGDEWWQSMIVAINEINSHYNNQTMVIQLKSGAGADAGSVIALQCQTRPASKRISKWRFGAQSVGACTGLNSVSAKINETSLFILTPCLRVTVGVKQWLNKTIEIVMLQVELF
jgi:hypothetical protein